MDAARKKLLSAIEAYEETTRGRVPDALKEQISDFKETITAPIYSQESPGERVAREVSEANMPPDVAEQYFDETETGDADRGVLTNI